MQKLNCWDEQFLIRLYNNTTVMQWSYTMFSNYLKKEKQTNHQWNSYTMLNYLQLQNVKNSQ